ncbi:MAG TPA: CvpA family protein [Pyrinomonadaceae bacterium]|jgi:uncharacterized protein YkwD
MNFIDIFLILFVLLSVVLGWRRGFILGVLDLVRWMSSLLLALRFYQPVSQALGALFRLTEVWSQPLAFLLIAMTTSLCVHLLGRKLLERLPENIHERQWNRLLGVLPGLVNGLIAATIAAPLLLALPLPDGLRVPVRESVVANRLAVISDRLETALVPIFDDAIRQTLNTRTVRPESDEVVKLPYTLADTQPLPELEAEMLNLVNQERARAGLAPLAPDPELTEVARRHSSDMFARGYFAHMTPEGRSPFDRMREAGVGYRAAGENLALAPTLAMAHTGLMNSPGHRANILRPQFGRLGIGIMDGGWRGLMVTQNFRD